MHVNSTIITFKCIIDSKNATRASVAVWLTPSVSVGEEWEGEGERGRGQAEGGTTITATSKHVDRWPLKVQALQRKRKIRTDAETQTTAQTLI